MGVVMRVCHISLLLLLCRVVCGLILQCARVHCLDGGESE